MPKKIRELKKMLAKAGYVQLPKRGKGSHTFWVHVLLPNEPLTIPGRDGDDAPKYLEKDVKQVLKKLNYLQQEEN